jgi:sugar-specific transcriptional regulator TrmB
MEIFEKLQQVGLTGNEAKVYLELLKKGVLSANKISKNLGMDRTSVYTILNHLIEKGQVNYIVKENKKFFSCSNPENFLNQVKTKEIIILELIDELKKIRKEDQQETEINIYEGKEGIRVFMNLVLKEKEFCAFGSTGRIFYQFYEIPTIIKQISKSNLKVRIIGDKKYKRTPAFNFKKFEFKFLDIESEATTSIFGDYISIHLIKDKPILIIIKNKDVAKGYKNYFEFLWKQANF